MMKSLNDYQTKIEIHQSGSIIQYPLVNSLKQYQRINIGRPLHEHPNVVTGVNASGGPPCLNRKWSKFTSCFGHEGFNCYFSLMYHSNNNQHQNERRSTHRSFFRVSGAQLNSKPDSDSTAYSNLDLSMAGSLKSGSLSKFIQVLAVGRRSSSLPTFWMQKGGSNS